jgi:hypothetical protein
VRDELNRLAGELRRRLPEHTYKAVIRRAKYEGETDAERRDFLTAAIEGWDNERAKERTWPLGEVPK